MPYLACHILRARIASGHLLGPRRALASGGPTLEPLLDSRFRAAAGNHVLVVHSVDVWILQLRSYFPVPVSPICQPQSTRRSFCYFLPRERRTRVLPRREVRTLRISVQRVHRTFQGPTTRGKRPPRPSTPWRTCKNTGQGSLLWLRKSATGTRSGD